MEKLDLSKAGLRKFAVTMAACLLIIGLVIFLKHREINKALLAASLLFLSAGIFIPGCLRVIYIPWMRLAEVLGYVVSRLILSLIFLLVLTPIGMILKIAGKDLLDKKLGNSSTYWKKVDPKSTDYERQF
ncbi:MAG: SxtJ family membrane protein [Candidatus Omnitrophica bacterium]|nr:SxtJ family membrane protein [Candidatus Omnitrophota bacterium]